jgi:methionyl-tRNA formyltransferase
MKIIVVAMEENIFLREVLAELFGAGITPDAILIEKSKRALQMIPYLKNSFYNPPEMRELLAGRSIPVHEVGDVNGDETQQLLRDLAPDVVVLGGSSRLVKPNVMRLAKVGMLNSHPGLLPDYRGMDVVGWAIYNADPVGATCHFIDEGADTGPILKREVVPFKKGESLLEIRVRVMRVAAKIMVLALGEVIAGTAKPMPQDPSAGKRYYPMPPEVLKAVEEKLAR